MIRLTRSGKGDRAQYEHMTTRGFNFTVESDAGPATFHFEMRGGSYDGGTGDYRIYYDLTQIELEDQ